MKNKLTLLFALLCASMMGFAIDWESKAWIGNGSGNGAYTDAMKADCPDGVNVVNLQIPGFSDSNAGIYITVPDAAFTKATFNGEERTIYTQGAGILFPLTSFTDMYTEVVILNDATPRWTFTIYWKDGVESSGGGGDAKTASELSLNSTSETLDADASETFTIIPTTAAGYDGTITYESSNTGIATVSSAGLVTAIGRGAATITVRASETENFTASSATFTATVTGALNWDAISWIGASGDKYKIDPAAGMNVVNVQKPGWAAEDGIYCSFPAGISACSLPSGSYAIDGAGIVLYLSAFAARETEVTVTANSVDYTFTVYYADGKEVVEVYDTNLALASNGSSATASSGNASLAIDGNEGTRWESASTDDETWTLDMGQKRIFNTIKILWEGAYCTQFELTWSNDGESWTNLYTETNLTQPGWQVIELAEDVTARYIKYHGTQRATVYGQSFFEFQVLLPNASVLTSINLTSNTSLMKIGQGYALTAQAKDQNNSNMAAELSWEISPAGAGHVTEGVYYPDLAGNATIRAYSGEVYSNAVNVFAVSSDNLALSTNIDTDNKIIAQSEFAPDGTSAFYAVDGNNGSAYQGSATNGTADDETSRTYTSWFVVDLGIAYDIEAVTIYFEGACAQDYHVDFSANNTDWVVGYNHVGSAGVNGRTDILSTQLANTTGVRYVKFESTKAATQWGMKIFEFQVFGSESASLTKTVSASVNNATMGTATVKQNDVVVTEVTTGSTVTFSAVANDGYVFVDWSNGETRATFDTEVDVAMNLTANFRALGTVYCNTEVISNREGDIHTAYVTMTQTSANNYKLIVRSTETLNNFTNTELLINGGTIQNLNGQGVLSNENHTLTYEFTSTTKPSMNSPYLYISIMNPNFTECWFAKLENIEFDVPCEDNVAVTSIALSQNAANLLVGRTLTLTPTFTPAYATDKALTWESSNPAVATVANGVVTAVATGTATITARLTSDNTIYATCTITVIDALTETVWHGYAVGNPPTESNILITYTVTRDVDQHLTFALTTDKDVLGFVAFINIEGVDHQLEGYGAEHTATYTTTDTYEDNVALECMWDVRGATYRQTYDFTYMIGSANAEPNVLVVDETQDNTTALAAHNNTEVAVVSVNRTFTAGNLYTLVLPFDLDEATLAEKLPGALTRLNNTYVKDNGDLRLNFVNASSLEAGVPYLYTPSADVKNPIFTDVTISNVLRPIVPADNYAAYYGIYAPLAGDGILGITNGYVLGGDRYLYRTADLPAEQTMKALRGYFVLNFPVSGPGLAPRARVVFENEEIETPTDVEQVLGENASSKVLRGGVLYILRDGKMYNAQGQLIESK